MLIVSVLGLLRRWDAVTVRRSGAGSSERERDNRDLVVDDSSIARDLIAEILESAGFDVATASDGREALERLRHFEADLVVSDVEMPVLGGFELLERIRAQSESLPVVMLTTRNSVS